MKTVLVLMTLLVPTIGVAANDKKEASAVAKQLIGDAYGVNPKFVEFTIADTSKVPFLSAKRLGKIWVSPFMLRWYGSADPDFNAGIGTSYALGRHSSVLLHTYRSYENGKIQPQVGWVIHF